jgi:putative transposase
MLRTYCYPLCANQVQEFALESWLVACQQLYNGALQHRRDAWRKQRVSVSLYDQHTDLTDLRASDPEWAAVPAWIARSALRRVDIAFKAFFRRVKAGQKPGFPRFRSINRYNTFDLGTNLPRIEGDRVHLPKLGPVRFHKYRELRGTIRHVSISRTVRGWSISFVCDLGEAPPKAAVCSAVGVDVGLEAFATLSTGERIENPRFGQEAQEVLARRQRSLARKRRGSNSRKEAKRLVARAYERIRNQRIDHARKLASLLFSRFDLVAHENLQIAHLGRGVLAKSIHDAAWGQFLRALHSKAENAGKWCVPVDPRGTSQACAACGAVARKELSQREHHCDCGFVAHRDHNAALNVLARGSRVGQLTEVNGFIESRDRAEKVKNLTAEKPVEEIDPLS